MLSQWGHVGFLSKILSRKTSNKSLKIAAEKKKTANSFLEQYFQCANVIVTYISCTSRLCALHFKGKGLKPCWGAKQAADINNSAVGCQGRKHRRSYETGNQQRITSARVETSMSFRASSKGGRCCKVSISASKIRRETEQAKVKNPQVQAGLLDQPEAETLSENHEKGIWQYVSKTDGNKTLKPPLMHRLNYSLLTLF